MELRMPLIPLYFDRGKKIKKGDGAMDSVFLFVALGAVVAGFVQGFSGFAFGMVFFGACAVAMVPMLLSRDVQVRISAQGIFWKRWNDQTIPWSEITDVSTWELTGQKVIVLKLRDASRFPGKGIQGLLAGPNRAMTGGDISVVLTGTDQSPDAAVAAIGKYRP